MTTVRRLQALNAGRWADFWALDDPKCPHCGATCSVFDNDWLALYEEGEHDVTCPGCAMDFVVSSRVSYSFSTDEQEGAE